MDLGVANLGVLGVFGVTCVVALVVPGVVSLGVTGANYLGIPVKVSLWVSGTVVFLVSFG